MLSAAVGLTAVRGDSLTLEFLVTDEDGAVANITGTTPTLALEHIRNPSNRVQVTGTVTDAEGGVFTASLTSAQTLVLLGVYIYQAALTDLSDNRQTVARGTVNFVDTVVNG